jgi:hypothetical protein
MTRRELDALGRVGSFENAIPPSGERYAHKPAHIRIGFHDQHDRGTAGHRALREETPDPGEEIDSKMPVAMSSIQALKS